MSFDFNIPLSVRDLVKSGGINQYVVQDVLSVRQLGAQISGFRAALRSKGPLCILEHFDTPYSVLYHFQSAETPLKEETLELLVQVVSRLSSALPAQLDDASLDSAQRRDLLNTVKMSCFLLSKLAESFENDAFKPGIVTATSKGSKKVKSKGIAGFDWESEREGVLQALIQLLQLDIRRLWNMSLVEEEFTSCVTCCCYKLLENPAINQVKSKGTRDGVIHLLGVLVKKYNHLLGASVKIIQLLQHFEHLAPVCVQAVSLWVSEYGVRSIVGEVMREIGQKSPEELSREGSGVRAYAAFLTELAACIPAAMLPSISVLLDHLDGESYTMRMAVLEVMGEMVSQVLSGEELEESGRDARDQFLDTLQEHLHDTNSFVRSRMLQTFTRIVNKKALPLARFRDVLTLTVGRLVDKSVNVCKNAIQLLAAFMANNPFTWKLSSVDLKAPLQKEVDKLKEMKDKAKEQAPVAVIEAWELWEAMEPELLQTVQSELQKGREEREGEEERVEETALAAAENIAHLLRNNKYRQAVSLTLACMKMFPEDDLFVVSGGEEEEEDEEDQPTEEAVMAVMALIFKGPEKSSESGGVETGNPQDPPLPSSEPGDPSAAAELLSKQEMLVQYLRDTHDFAVKIEEAIAVISTMLYWKTTSVVQEAIDFFVTVSEFGVSQALVGVRRMLPLVWSKDAGVKEAVVEAYRRLYLNPAGDSQRAKAQSLVQNLSMLMVDASLGTIECLEEIIFDFFQKKELPPAVLQLLWERFTGKLSSSSLERRAAVLLLGMAARAEREIVFSNLDTLVSVGLGEKVQEDFQLARDTCITIGKIADSGKPKPGKSSKPFRLPQDHQLFTCLTNAITTGLLSQDLYWLSFSEHAVSLLYRLSESPDRTCAHILRRCSALLLEELSKEGEASSQSDNSLEEKDLSQSQPSVSGSLPSYLLSHLLSLVGCVGFHQVEHLERSVSAELRRRRVEKEEQEEERGGRGKAGAATRRKSKAGDDTLDEEMGLVGASAEDTEAELIRRICETELLSGEQMLSSFVPLILQVCNNPGKYSDPQLTTTACLALSKYMMISSEFCDAHLRLLFTMLEKSALPSVRSNTIIALGDLTIRFPNLIEPWTPHLYARLRDDAPSVRKTAVIVMTHLILKDMVKVKGQVSEMAVLLMDSEQEIMALAFNFFNELAAKDNAIYNLLPDIISRLSDPENGVEEEPFHTIMKQLFSYITKDKQTESLVEKLCQRFRTARTERQWRDLAYCLSLLSFAERGLRKMQENFECFGDKLGEEAVYQSFITTMGKIRRGAKPEVKALVDEFEHKLTACHTRGMENLEPGESQPAPISTPASKLDKRGARGARSQALSTQNRNDDSDFVTPRPRRTRKPAPRRQRAAITFSSDEEDEESAGDLFLFILFDSGDAHSTCCRFTLPVQQLLARLIEKYSDLLTADDLSEDMSGEHIESEKLRVKVKEQKMWVEPPTANEKAWLRLLRGSLANRKWEPVDRLKKGWARGCFGLKLDRIGSISGLGC
ncbi:Condensin complex subunit 1 [Acipenser ruthenus]|uniref:Condensin complex subunit 1 n=1 Tax=Acipenser ruthenus TaxID=7906 RepID=A0A444UNK1_ACIRT|nr:Condensin complex subunit 1 [Acipenser ruthenus]